MREGGGGSDGFTSFTLAHTDVGKAVILDEEADIGVRKSTPPLCHTLNNSAGCELAFWTTE